NDLIAADIQQAYSATMKMRKRLQPGTLQVLVPDAPDVVNIEGEPAPPVDANPEFDWLTYETRINSAKFQKDKTPVAYGLFAVPLDHGAEVVAWEMLPDLLAGAFFPGMSLAEVQEVSKQTCRWRGAGGKPTGHGPNSPAEQTAARGQAVIHAPRMMVMPYNYYANDNQSHAIGTILESEVKPGPGFRLKKVWPLWETAPRASLACLEPTSEADLAQTGQLATNWEYRSKQTPTGADLPTSVKDKPFKLGSPEFKDSYSVKTGVRWLGQTPQGSGDAGGGKDVLESNALLASMRSDWVEHGEKAKGRAPKLIVLTELVPVT